MDEYKVFVDNMRELQVEFVDFPGLQHRAARHQLRSAATLSAIIDDMMKIMAGVEIEKFVSSRVDARNIKATTTGAGVRKIAEEVLKVEILRELQGAIREFTRAHPLD